MYVASGSATAGALFASVHVLMDLDHIPDYIDRYAQKSR